MVVRSLEVEKDHFRPRKQDEEALRPETPYLSAIGTFMYLANNTRPDITFAVNLLASFTLLKGIRMELNIYQISSGDN